jgi:hypothetical protein
MPDTIGLRNLLIIKRNLTGPRANAKFCFEVISYSAGEVLSTILLLYVLLFGASNHQFRVA